MHFIHLIDCLFIQVSWEEAKWFWIYLLNSICYPLYLCHVSSCLSSSKLNSTNLFTLSSFRSLFIPPQISIIPVQALLFPLFPFWVRVIRIEHKESFYNNIILIFSVISLPWLIPFIWFLSTARHGGKPFAELSRVIPMTLSQVLMVNWESVMWSRSSLVISAISADAERPRASVYSFCQTKEADCIYCSPKAKPQGF